jgi:hypothetical protein
VEGIDAIVNKRNWIKQWSSADFGLKMTASACIHGIFFISLDLVLNWLKNKFRGSFTHELIEIIEKMIADQVSTPSPSNNGNNRCFTNIYSNKTGIVS